MQQVNREAGNMGEETVKSDFFKGVYQWKNKEYDVALPIFYYDCSAMTTIYTASTKLVKQYLPTGELHPLEIVPGRCLVIVSAFEYRKTDIGAYNEFSIAVAVRHGKKPLPLLPVIAAMLKKTIEVFIIHLPVNSEPARRGGVELGGFPKYLADIDFHRDQTYTECTVSLDKKHILTMLGKKAKTSGSGKQKVVSYTLLNGCMVRSVMWMKPHQFAQSINPNMAFIKTGENHPMVEVLSGIGMGKKPLAYQLIPSYDAILCGPKNVIDN